MPPSNRISSGDRETFDQVSKTLSALNVSVMAANVFSCVHLVGYLTPKVKKTLWDLGATINDRENPDEESS